MAIESGEKEKDHPHSFIVCVYYTLLIFHLLQTM